MATKKLTFEEQIARLEAIVRQLEQGEAPLEESLRLFEEGAALLRGCTQMLDKAEQKVTKLRQGSDGKPVEELFAQEEA